jgi:hypothetical protein
MYNLDLAIFVYTRDGANGVIIFQHYFSSMAHREQNVSNVRLTIPPVEVTVDDENWQAFDDAVAKSSIWHTLVAAKVSIFTRAAVNVGDEPMAWWAASHDLSGPCIFMSAVQDRCNGKGHA